MSIIQNTCTMVPAVTNVCLDSRNPLKILNLVCLVVSTGRKAWVLIVEWEQWELVFVEHCQKHFPVYRFAQDQVSTKTYYKSLVLIKF